MIVVLDFQNSRQSSGSGSASLPAVIYQKSGGKHNENFRGWVKSGCDHMLFETLCESLEIGEKIEINGRLWEVEVIFLILPGDASGAGSSLRRRGFISRPPGKRGESKNMKVNEIIEAEIVDNRVLIIIHDENLNMLAKGNWFMDSILKYIDRKAESFTWQDDDKLYITVK